MTTERSWLVIQHVPFEGPGLIAEVAARRGVPLRVCRLYEGAALPPASELDGLVVMGGPMGVNDTVEHPYLLPERELIATLVQQGKPVLGVCLGAQLLAAALGARVYRGGQLEIGTGSVSLTAEGSADPVLSATGVQTLPVVHWHQDTFDLPEDTRWLARSELYPHQAFRAGRRAYGLQFHVEVNSELAAAWAEHLPPGVKIEDSARRAVQQSGERILEAFFDVAAGN
jgi:GMP synthase-like glutamine amidotransferase